MVDNALNWGYHLIVDANYCNYSINNVSVVAEFIKVLVDMLKMHPLGKPSIVYVDTEEGKGVSAIQLITTSSITFHGDEEYGCAFIDIFSCKEYDANVVLSLIKEYFNPGDIQHRMVHRCTLPERPQT